MTVQASKSTLQFYINKLSTSFNSVNNQNIVRCVEKITKGTFKTDTAKVIEVEPVYDIDGRRINTDLYISHINIEHIIYHVITYMYTTFIIKEDIYTDSFLSTIDEILTRDPNRVNILKTYIILSGENVVGYKEFPPSYIYDYYEGHYLESPGMYNNMFYNYIDFSQFEIVDTPLCIKHPKIGTIYFTFNPEQKTVVISTIVGKYGQFYPFLSLIRFFD